MGRGNSNPAPLLFVMALASDDTISLWRDSLTGVFARSEDVAGREFEENHRLIVRRRFNRRYSTRQRRKKTSQGISQSAAKPNVARAAMF